MRKFLFSSLLIVSSMSAYADNASQLDETKEEQKMLCNQPLTYEKNLNQEDIKKQILVSVEYYREFKNKSKKSIKSTIGNVNLVHINGGDTISFGISSHSRYLVRISNETGEILNIGHLYTNNLEHTQKRQAAFDKQSLYGNIYTTIDKDHDNQANVKICLYKTNGLNNSSQYYSTYKEMSVDFNSPTVIALNNGYSVKIKFLK